MKIKNIVFDIGNVLVKWDPLFIISQAFPDASNPKFLQDNIFKSATWLDLNLGKITEQQSILEYHKNLGIDLPDLQNLMQAIKDSMDLVDGTYEILDKIKNQGYNLYALTNNTNEIVSYLKKRYGLEKFFKSIVSSSEVGLRKPNLDIYRHLLEAHKLSAHETLFIDDHLPNLAPAESLGIRVLLFENINQLRSDLSTMDIAV